MALDFTVSVGDCRSTMKSNPAIQRQRRRASQARHRLNVATCYNRLRLVVPGGMNDSYGYRSGCRAAFSPAMKSLNKTALLERASEYIEYLEKTVDDMLVARELTTADSSEQVDTDEDICAIDKFSCLRNFREHFATNFSVEDETFRGFGSESSPSISRRYFLKDGNATWTNQPGKSYKTGVGCSCSPAQSDDLGFVSSEMDSQDASQESLSSYYLQRDARQRLYLYNMPGQYGPYQPVNQLDIRSPGSNFYLFYPPQSNPEQASGELYNKCLYDHAQNQSRGRPQLSWPAKGVQTRKDFPLRGNVADDAERDKRSRDQQLHVSQIIQQLLDEERNLPSRVPVNVSMCNTGYNIQDEYVLADDWQGSDEEDDTSQTVIVVQDADPDGEALNSRERKEE